LIYKLLEMKFEDLDINSRVWVYQSDRPFLPSETEVIEKEIALFVNEWNAHGNELTAGGKIEENHFLILAVDPQYGSASGCSIDSSVRFVKSLGEKLGVNFFNRLKVLTINEQGEPEYVPYGKLRDFPQRLMFNTLVDTRQDFEKAFKIPVSRYLDSLK